MRKREKWKIKKRTEYSTFASLPRQPHSTAPCEKRNGKEFCGHHREAVSASKENGVLSLRNHRDCSRGSTFRAPGELELSKPCMPEFRREFEATYWGV